MTERVPLPRDFNRLAFTTRELVEAGLGRGRLRASDIKKSPVGLIYLDAREANSELEMVRALERSFPDVWLSHVSAARWHGLFLPPRMQEDYRLHVSVPFENAPIRRRGVAGHRSRNTNALMTAKGIRVSSPGRTVLELSGDLNSDELTVLGDQLVRVPRAHFESRSTPHLTLESWHSIVLSDKRSAKKSLLDSLELVRVGSDSPQETALRLKLVRCGFPEPSLQIPVEPGNKYSPTADLGYGEHRIAFHYDGSTHYRSDSFAKDQRRDAAFEAYGWRNIRCSAEDARSGFNTVILTAVEVFLAQSHRFNLNIPHQVASLAMEHGLL